MKKITLLLSLLVSSIFVNGQQTQQMSQLQQNTHQGLRQAEQNIAITAKPENTNALNQVKSLLCTDTIRYPQVKEQLLNAAPAFYLLELWADDAEEISQTFLHSGSNLTIRGIEFFGKRNATSTASVTMTASIFAVTAGYVPTGAALATGTVVVTSTTAGYKYVTFATPIVVTGNYAVVVKPSNAGGIFDFYINNIAQGQPQDENLARYKSSYYASSGGQWITTPQFTEFGTTHFEPLVAPLVSYTINTTAIASPDPVCLGTPIVFTGTSTPVSILSNRMYNYNVFNTYFNGAVTDSTYVWDMDNLSPYIWSSSTSYTYPAAGVYDATRYTLGGFWNSCADFATDIVTVNALPTVTANATSTTICSGTSTTLSAGGAPSLTWDNGIGAVTSPVVSPLSTTTYTVTGTDASGCTNTAQVTINVTPSDDATFNYSTNTFCTTGSNETPTVVTAGTFSSTAGLVFANTSTGEINVAGSTAGTYTVTNTTAGICPDVATQSITIATIPDATFSYAQAAYCTGTSNPSPVFIPGASAGTFSSSAGMVFTNPTTGVINLSTSTAGSYTVTNTIAASGSCPMATATYSVTINTSPSATVTGGGTMCGDGSTPIPVTIALSGSGPWDVMYSNGTTTQTVVGQLTSPLTISATTSGTYTVTSVSNSNCTTTGMGSATVVFNANPTVSITPVSAICDNSSAVNMVASPVGGTFSGTGMTGNIFDPAIGAGSYTVTYNYTDGNACSGSTTTNITVNQSPNVSLSAFTAMCMQDAALTLSGGLPAGGTYSGTGVASGIFDPSIAGAGSQTITYTFQDVNTCTSAASQTILVNDCAGLTDLVGTTITLAPNPVTDQLFITVDSADGSEIVWNMVTEEGKIVISSRAIANGTQTINVSNFAKGVYFIQFNSNKGSMTKKVMIH